MTATSVVWTAADNDTFISVFEKAVEEGLRSDNGWKPVVWQRAMNALCGSEAISGGTSKGISQCKSHYQRVSFFSNLMH